MALDPRGPRFAAWITTGVFVLVLVTSSGWLAAAQALVFAITTAAPRWGPYSLLYRTIVAPRLSPPTELEPAAPVRFSQAVGFVFAVLAAIGYLTGATTLGWIAAGAALGAAFLNAAFGFCLGCELYLLVLRTLNRPLPHRVPLPSEGANP